MKSKSSLLRMVESALLLAIAVVLSLVKLLDLPYGGSITACSALPILLVSYRHGIGHGLFTAFAYALLQLLLGLNTLSYVTTPLSVAAVIVLDYLLAFTALGLGGIFRRKAATQTSALVKGALFTCLLRYLLHVVAGCTVWAGLSIPTEAALLYSLAYNATYMLPETLVTTLGALYLSRVLDVREVIPTRAPAMQAQSRPAFWLGVISKLFVTAAAVWDIVEIFRHLQHAETGDFLLSGLAEVRWLSVLLITVGGLLLAGITEWARRRVKD